MQEPIGESVKSGSNSSVSALSGLLSGASTAFSAACLRFIVPMLLLYIPGVILVMPMPASLPANWGAALLSTGCALVGCPMLYKYLENRYSPVAAYMRWQAVPRRAKLLLGVAVLIQVILFLAQAIAEETFQLHPRTTAPAFVALSLQALLLPVAEEMLFRVALLGGLLALKVNLPLALALQALLFGAAHLDAGLPAQLLTASLGLSYGLVTLGLRTVWPALVLHVLWNAAEGIRFTLTGGDVHDVGASYTEAADLLFHGLSALVFLVTSLLIFRGRQDDASRRDQPSP